MNHNYAYRIFNLLILLLAFFSIHGQQNDNFNITDVTENIKINTDRDLYFCGEDIYFNADYFINEEKTYPILSTVLYLELIECDNNTPIIQKKYKISDFNVNGQLNIPKDVASGNYMLRIYTQYQRNFSALNFSYHFLTILNPNHNPLTSSYLSETDSIYIAAEGNILLNNIKNKVVIKIPESLVSNNNKYFITDETNSIIREVHPLNYGFIQTEMTFNKSKQYKLTLIKSTGDTLSRIFPKVQNDGIQTNIQSTANNIYYKILNKKPINDNQDFNYQIKIFSNDFTVKYIKDISFNDSIFGINIATSVLGNGINYIVLTDNENIKKINSIYKSSRQFNAINIEVNTDNYEPRETINAYITTKNEDQKELPVVSVSVTRHGTKKEEHNFISTSYLKYPILLENFLNSNTQLNNEWQNQIMILFDETLDKESFDKRINKSKTTSLEYIPEVRDLTISGILKNKKTKEPISNHKIYLSVLFNSPQIHIYKTRKNGEFIFSLNNVYGTNDVFLCSEAFTEEEEHELLIKSSFSSDIPSIDTIPTFINYADIELLKEIYINAQIQQRFCIKQDTKLIKKSNMPSFNLNDNKTIIIPDNYVELESMKELFYEIVPNVVLKKIKNQFYFKILNENDYMLPGTPIILIDNIPIFDPNKIMQLDPSQIKKIEVIYKTYILGSHTINGVIMLTTNTDNFAGIELPKSATFIEYQTLEKQNNYLDINKDSSNASLRIPDFRTTLYWNPQIKLTDKGQNICFNASDRKGIYDIIIKGYTSEGQIYYGKKQICIR